jgi:hypothetical protein
MTHLEMKRFLEWLKTDNAQRLREGRAIIEPFYPHDFLKGKEDNAAVSDDFAHLVFLKATEADISSLVESNRLTHTHAHLKYYLDTDGTHATVPDKMMQQFLQACMKYRGQFELAAPIRSIEAMDRVLIKSGPFAGQEALVESVHFHHGAIHVELILQFVSGVMSIRMSNVGKDQIDILNRDTSDAIRSDFMEYTQNHLLRILEHRVKRMDDEKTNQQDADMLTRLYRYRYYDIKNEAARCHFLALMLICAHLCHYTAEEQLLREKVQAQLDDINRRSEWKAATDTRAYLLVALYISTHNPAYRDAAKQYVRDHQPKSAKLRSFVSLIRTGRKV